MAKMAKLVEEGTDVPCFVAIAGRPKLMKMEKFLEKRVKKRTSLGRGVWMYDGHESLVCKKFMLPLYKDLRD
jgi:hypothetical protein